MRERNEMMRSGRKGKASPAPYEMISGHRCLFWAHVLLTLISLPPSTCAALLPKRNRRDLHGSGYHFIFVPARRARPFEPRTVRLVQLPRRSPQANWDSQSHMTIACDWGSRAVLFRIPRFSPGSLLCTLGVLPDVFVVSSFLTSLNRQSASGARTGGPPVPSTDDGLSAPVRSFWRRISRATAAAGQNRHSSPISSLSQ